MTTLYESVKDKKETPAFDEIFDSSGELRVSTYGRAKNGAWYEVGKKKTRTTTTLTKTTGG
jgi:hypothetical protein